ARRGERERQFPLRTRREVRLQSTRWRRPVRIGFHAENATKVRGTDRASLGYGLRYLKIVDEIAPLNTLWDIQRERELQVCVVAAECLEYVDRHGKPNLHELSQAQSCKILLPYVRIV